MGFHFNPFPHRIIAGRDHSASASLRDLNRAESAGALGCQLWVVAEGWDRDRILLTHLQECGVLFGFNSFAINR